MLKSNFHLILILLLVISAQQNEDIKPTNLQIALSTSLDNLAESVIELKLRISGITSNLIKNAFNDHNTKFRIEDISFNTLQPINDGKHDEAHCGIKDSNLELELQWEGHSFVGNMTYDDNLLFNLYEFSYTTYNVSTKIYSAKTAEGGPNHSNEVITHTMVKNSTMQLKRCQSTEALDVSKLELFRNGLMNALTSVTQKVFVDYMSYAKEHAYDGKTFKFCLTSNYTDFDNARQNKAFSLTPKPEDSKLEEKNDSIPIFMLAVNDITIPRIIHAYQVFDLKIGQLSTKQHSNAILGNLHGIIRWYYMVEKNDQKTQRKTNFTIDTIRFNKNESNNETDPYLADLKINISQEDVAEDDCNKDVPLIEKILEMKIKRIIVSYLAKPKPQTNI